MQNLSKNTKIALVILIIVGILILGIIIFGILNNTNTSQTNSSTTNTIDTDNLAQYDGKNGNKCLIKIDTVLYQVPEGTEDWVNGEHVKSKGIAKCGEDLSGVLDKSPHGDSVLKDLVVVNK